MRAVELEAIVDRKLRKHPGGMRPNHAFEARLGLDLTQPLPTEDELCTVVWALMRVSPDDVLEFQSKGGDFDLLHTLLRGLGAIWRLMVPDRRDDEAIKQNFAWARKMALQRYRDLFASSELWRREIAAIGRREGWL